MERPGRRHVRSISLEMEHDAFLELQKKKNIVYQWSFYVMVYTNFVMITPPPF
jgi:hypothetical protein